MTNPTVDLGTPVFVENTGSALSLDCYRSDAVIIDAAAQPVGIDVNSPTDGALLSISRDGKIALAVTPRVIIYDGQVPGIDYPYFPIYEPSEAGGLAGAGATWIGFVTALQTLGNGYSWTFEPLFSNLSSFLCSGVDNGIDQIVTGALLPAPTKFGPVRFTMGQTIAIPIAVRCTSYVNNCPWSVNGAHSVTGDDPVQDDQFTAGLLCLSDMVGALANVTVTVQSATVAAAGDPYMPTADYGPSELTTDSNGFLQITIDSSQSVTGGVLSPQIDGIVVSFDEGTAQGQSSPTGKMRSVFVPMRNGEETPLLDGGTVARVNPPNVSRRNMGAFCFRASQSQDVKYSEPRNALWSLSSDYKGRILATLLAAFAPYAQQTSRYPKRGTSFVFGFKPRFAIYEALIVAVYQTFATKWVTCASLDQLTTLEAEVTIFNQSFPGETNLAIDQSTGSVWYVMAVRNDALSWLSTPEANDNPDGLPQVLVLRRRDASGTGLPFVKASTAGLSGTLWENVVYVNQPSNGTCGVQILPTGVVLVSCGNTLMQTLDSGTTWTDANTGASYEALSTQSGGELQSGAEGGTQNP